MSLAHLAIPPQIQAITLDLDDTLWPIGPVIRRADAVLNAWLDAHFPALGARYRDDQLLDLRRAVVAEFPDRAHDFQFLRTTTLARAAQALDLPHFCADTAYEIFHNARNQVTLFPEVTTALDALVVHYPLIALSNGTTDIHRAGLSHWFIDSFTAAQVGYPKPHPAMFLAACSKLNLPPEAVLHLGDDPLHDVAGAQQVGMATVWINREGRDWPAELPRPHLEWPDLGAIFLDR